MESYLNNAPYLSLFNIEDGGHMEEEEVEAGRITFKKMFVQIHG